MITKLEHPVVKDIYCWESLLSDCSKLSTFVGRIEKITKNIKEVDEKEENEWFHLSGKKNAMKFKGDVFEVFCELLVRLSPIDDRIGITDYHVVTDGDTGVDGYGKMRDGSPATVQIKYRMWDWELKAIREHLNNFRLTSFMKHDIDPQATQGQMLIITTGKEIHWKTLETQFLKGSVRCISLNASYGCLRGGKQHTIDSLYSLKTIVNDNAYFWEKFRELTRKDV